MNKLQNDCIVSKRIHDVVKVYLQAVAQEEKKITVIVVICMKSFI